MTSIEWLASKLSITFNTMYAEEIQQAKEMHKQEIIDAWEMGRFNIDEVGLGEQYYYKTFLSKGSDNLTKEIINFMKKEKERKLQLPQQETLYIEERIISRAIALYLEGHSFSEIIQLFKKPKKD
jgi:hypothetical protein